MIKLILTLRLFYPFRINMNVPPAVADHTNEDTLLRASYSQDQQLIRAVMGAKIKSVEN